jgi:hypothetical protein
MAMSSVTSGWAFLYYSGISLSMVTQNNNAWAPQMGSPWYRDVDTT